MLSWRGGGQVQVRLDESRRRRRLMSFASVLFQVCLDRLQQVEFTARLTAVLRRVPHLLAATAGSPTWEYHIFFQTISETHNKTYESYMRRGWISRQLGGVA